jgi:hypothetical protein
MTSCRVSRKPWLFALARSPWTLVPASDGADATRLDQSERPERGALAVALDDNERAYRPMLGALSQRAKRSGAAGCHLRTLSRPTPRERSAPFCQLPAASDSAPLAAGWPGAGYESGVLVSGVRPRSASTRSESQYVTNLIAVPSRRWNRFAPFVLNAPRSTPPVSPRALNGPGCSALPP